MSGAIGTLVALERAVAVQRRVALVAPGLGAASVLAVVAGAPSGVPALLAIAAAIALLAVTVVGAPSARSRPER